MTKGELPLQATLYDSLRNELTVPDELILKGKRVVIPATLRQQMKNEVHSSHMGIEACLRRARKYISWPGMSAEIKHLIEACETCRTFKTSQ